MTRTLMDMLFGKDGGPLFIIAGPCVLESDAIVRETAGRLRDLCGELDLPLIFKGSYDKANRTSVQSFRGPGLARGLALLKEVQASFSLPVLTDVHSPDEALQAAEIADVIQIPAFLCRQTDLILAAARTGKPVNVKKGQFLAPWDVKNIIEKFRSTGNDRIMITERGTSFGYNNLVVDFRALPLMRAFGCPVVFDVTHSLQIPGGLGTASGGQREFAPALARAAAAVGVNGLFLEVHPSPETALCDGPNMIQLDMLPPILRQIKAIDAVLREDPSRAATN